MARIVLVTGGARSGKSTYAQELAERLRGPRLFLATAEPFDEEMRERIRRHKESRAGSGWSTIEEPVRLAAALKDAQEYPVVVVDCVTVWVNNLMYEADRSARPGEPGLSEETMAETCREVLTAAGEHRGTVILVTNEVGLGIVPENPASRLFRDLLGRCNRMTAAAADTVVLMVCGLPCTLKGSEAGP